MKLNPQDLEEIADRTLEHYNEGAEDFWERPMRVIALIENCHACSPAQRLRRNLTHQSHVHL